LEPVQGQTDGRIESRPVAQLFVELLRLRASGGLTLTQDATVRVVHFQSGVVRFAESNVKSESAGQAQVALGTIKQASFDRAVALARQQNVALHEALASARVLSPEQLKTALKGQTAEVAIAGLGLHTGTHVFAPRPVETLNALPDSRMSPVSLIVDWARRSASPVAMRAWLEKYATAKVMRSQELERELFALKAIWPGESVTPGASAGRTLGELLARVKESELPLLYGLCASGLFVLGSASNPGMAKSVGQPAVSEDVGKVFTKREHDTRRLIFDESARLRDATHYEVLSVLPSATPEQIKAAYFAAARKFHSDAFSSLELGSARRGSEELFQKINEANQVLGNPKTRGEYDVFVDRKAKGLPTDVAAILKAESVFQKGEIFYNAGKHEDAELCFREAIGLNHAEAEFHAYLGMTLFRRRGSAQDAYEQVAKALQIDPRLPSAQVFQSVLQAAMGDDDASKKTMRKLLEQDPDNALAKAEMARQRAKALEQSKKPGFFGGLFKK